MDMDNFLSPRWPDKKQIQKNRTIPGLASRAAADNSAPTKNFAPVTHYLKESRELRSIVKRRFTWMSEAHDRIRLKILSDRLVHPR
jgi:hypothetical protein